MFACTSFLSKDISSFALFRPASSGRFLHTPQLFRWTHENTGFLHKGVPTHMHVQCRFCVRTQQNQAKRTKVSSKRGTHPSPLRRSFRGPVRPRIWVLRALKTSPSDTSSPASFLASFLVLPLLCWVRGARGPSPRNLEGAREGKRGRAFLSHIPCVKVCFGKSALQKIACATRIVLALSAQSG